MKAGKLTSRSAYVCMLATIAWGAAMTLIPGCPNGVVPCTTAAGCDDGDVCTTDTCDVDTGVCSNDPVETPVSVSASVDGEAVPGAALTATASVDICDASTIESYAWAQSNSVAVTIEGADTAAATVTLPAIGAYKDELFAFLVEPPIGEDDFPPNIEVPEGESPGGLQDRFQVVGLAPFTLEEAGLVVLEVTVTTSSGTYMAEADIETELPWKINPGLMNVPIGNPLLLHGKTQDAYDWALAGPGGTLADATSQNPYFTPDVAGLYSVTVTDTTGDAPAVVTLNIYAGTWAGVIVGQDADGRPESSAACTGCHNGTIAADTFTPWAQTGHADIFSVNLDTSDHYGTGCLPCHAVGYDTGADNGGMDDAEDYDAFLAEFAPEDGASIHSAEGNWTTMLASYPAAAQLANIQCENCHGPQNGPAGEAAHTMGAPRINLSSDVCAVCHGEPARHGRFQQWQISGHANYELAIDEGESGSCARCHTANGFLAWLPVLLDDDPATDPLDSIEVTWAPDDIHPLTCVACHDPHSIGTSTGIDTDATVRISGDTPPLVAGFTATDVGRGAICMTCHNSRRGLRNDDTFADSLAAGDGARAPHGSAQADVLMGQNAYLVDVGTRGSHSTVEDACVYCHMEATPPPAALSYNLGGTNHAFSAQADTCSDCHAFGPEVVQPGVQADMDELKGLIEDAILQVITDQIAAGNTIDLAGEATITDAADIESIDFGESRGRQGITVTMGGTAFGPYRLPDVEVVDPAAAVLGELYDFADEALMKAGWNWILINNDGSTGVHNFTFVSAVLDASIAALTAG